MNDKETALNAHTSFKIKLEGTPEEIKAYGEVLKKRICDAEFEISAAISIDRSEICVFQEDLDSLVPEMIKAAPEGAFVINGIIDTSFSSGQERKFKYEYKNAEVKVYYSDWYIETCMDYYEDYEDFCDSFYEITKKEYNRLCKFEYVYLLDTLEGRIFSDKIIMREAGFNF